MQTTLQPHKMALIIDEEILDVLCDFCGGELALMEDNDDDFGDLPPEEDIKHRFWFMNRHQIMKRLEKGLDSLCEQVDRPGCRIVYRERRGKDE